MIIYSDDPTRDAERHAEQQDAATDALAKCDKCRDPIQDDYAYLINDEQLCGYCMEKKYRIYI